MGGLVCLTKDYVVLFPPIIFFRVESLALIISIVFSYIIFFRVGSIALGPDFSSVWDPSLPNQISFV